MEKYTNKNTTKEYNIHWHLLLRFAKASKRFYQPWVCRGCALGLCCGLSTGCLPSRHPPRS